MSRGRTRTTGFHRYKVPLLGFVDFNSSPYGCLPRLGVEHKSLDPSVGATSPHSKRLIGGATVLSEMTANTGITSRRHRCTALHATISASTRRIMGEARKVPVTIDAGGDAIFPYFNPVLYERIPLLEPQQGDIIQVTYPRSGTHWVQQIIQLILNKGESERNYMDFMIKSPFIEAMELGATKAPRLLRTHSSMARLQFSKKAKYVYVARNPWDCCVSCFHFVREIPECKFEDGTFDEFVDSFLEGKFGFGEYFSHVLYGYGSRTEPNVFFVTYEELHKDKADVALRLAYFLGEDHGKMLEANQDVFQKVMEKSTATYMRTLMTTTPEDMSNIIAKSFGLVPSSSATNRVKSEDRREVNILRKGEVGEWKQYFSKRSIKKMKAAIEVRTKGSDVMTLWKCHDASLEISS